MTTTRSKALHRPRGSSHPTRCGKRPPPRRPLERRPPIIQPRKSALATMAYCTSSSMAIRTPYDRPLRRFALQPLLARTRDDVGQGDAKVSEKGPRRLEPRSSGPVRAAPRAADSCFDDLSETGAHGRIAHKAITRPRARGQSQRRGCDSRRCACWRPDPRRLATAPGCRSAGGAGALAKACAAAGLDEIQQPRTLGRMRSVCLRTGDAVAGRFRVGGAAGSSPIRHFQAGCRSRSEAGLAGERCCRGASARER
jgi:hypothetical protein